MPASDIIYVGRSLATLLEDVPATVDFDEVGVASAELNYTILWDNAPRLVSQMYQHPDYPFLKRKTASIKRIEANMAKVTVRFEGVEAGSGSGGSSGGAKYSVVGSTSSEPIEAHENFHRMAGKWWEKDSWINGAKFATDLDNEGKFLGFRMEKQENGEPTPNKKAGVTSYLEGGMIFREVKTYGSSTTGDSVKAQMAKLGFIDTPPNVESFVELEASRNWLLVTCSVEQVGDGIKVTREWRCSGRSGWDAHIYNKDIQ